MAAVVRALLRSELGNRYELTAITTHRTGSLAKRLIVSVSGMAQLARWCLSHPGAIVHVHSAVRGSIYRKAVAVALARLLRARVVLQLHAGPGDIETFAATLGLLRRAALRWALGLATAVVSVSEAGADALSAALGLQAIEVIPNAAPDPPNDIADPVAGVVLFLGGFDDPAKGGAELLRALPAMLDRVGAMRLVAAGPGEPPDRLRRMPGERVEWRGWLDDQEKRDALEEAQVVVLPSVSEGLPIVLLEAMGYGRAVVATSVGGLPEVVSDGIDGVLVPARAPAKLADAVCGLLEDPARSRTIGAAARRRVKRMSERDLVERLDRLYASVGTR